MSAKKKPSPIKRGILSRVGWLYFWFFAIGVVVAVRLVWVQMVSEEVRVNAERLQSRIFTREVLPARRGSILARDGEPLATSLFRYQVAVDFASEGLRTDERDFYRNSDSLAQLLSIYFGDRTHAQYAELLQREYLRERDNYRLDTTKLHDTLLLRDDFKEKGFLGRIIARINGTATHRVRYYDTIRTHRPVKLFPRTVDYAEWEVLRRYPLLNWNMGMIYHLEEIDTRVYPQGGLARRTIGDRGHAVKPKRPDGSDTLAGNYGIDDTFREELTGRDGWEMRQRIARGFYGRVPGAEREDPVSGMDVVTTLDMELQDVADRALRAQLVKQNATWGTTIVMETRTGEILAMANVGRGGDGSYSERENYALKMVMEPGSTFKLATVLLLLDDAKMSPATQYNTHNGDAVNVGPAKKIRDSHRGDRVIDLRRAIAASSNVYFAKAVWDRYGITGRKMDYSRFLHERLHLGETVGLERFGERRPQVTEDWKVADPGIMLVKMSYGYRVELAPIHVLTLYNAIANGGRMITPLLVSELRRDGETVQSFGSRTVAEEIASPEALAYVLEALKAVCTEGTASQFFADTARMRVAAKTGTAQVTQPREEPGQHYLGSMVAFFPADNPRYTVLTSIETRHQSGKAYYGGPLAGPVVKQVVDYICNHNTEWFAEVEGAGVYRPSEIKGGDAEQIRLVADEFDIGVDAAERRGWGTARTDPSAGLFVESVPESREVMPDVRGMGLKDALFLLENRGLKVKFSGAGRVVRQSIAPSTALAGGERVEIVLER